MNQDPLGLEAGDVNLYRYVKNNPVNKVDPSGLFFVELFEGASNLVEAGVQTAQRGARAVASTARSVSKRVVQGVEAAAVRTFNVGLKAANLSPERFWNVLDNLGDVVKPLINDGKRLVTNFLKGVGQRFEGFFNDIGKHVLGGLTEWLLNERITDFSDLGGVFLRILGVSWDQILGIASEVVGAKRFGMMLKLFDTIGDAIEKGPGKWLEEQKEKIQFKAEELRDKVG